MATIQRPATTAGRGGRPFAASTGFAGVSVGLNLLTGIFGFLGAGERAGDLESRAELLQLEADADAQRFQEEGEAFRASQAVAAKINGSRLNRHAGDCHFPVCALCHVQIFFPSKQLRGWGMGVSPFIPPDPDPKYQSMGGL